METKLHGSLPWAPVDSSVHHSGTSHYPQWGGKGSATNGETGIVVSSADSAGVSGIGLSFLLWPPKRSQTRMVSSLAGLQCSMCCPSVGFLNSAEWGRSQTVLLYMWTSVRPWQCLKGQDGADSSMLRHSEEDCQSYQVHVHMYICHDDHTWLDKVIFLTSLLQCCKETHYPPSCLQW